MGTENLYKSRILLKFRMNLRHFYDRKSQAMINNIVKQVNVFATAGDALGTENLYKSRILLKFRMNLRHFYDRKSQAMINNIVKQVNVLKEVITENRIDI